MSAPAGAGLFVSARETGGLGRIDPRVRLAVALGFLGALPLLHAPLALGAALALGVVAVAAAGVPFGWLWPRLAAVEAFLIVLLLTLPLTYPGTPLLSVFGLTVSEDGAARALTILLRVNAGVLLTLALVGRLGSLRLGAAMRGLGLPDRLIALMQMTVRYVFLFEDEYRRLRRAMRARAFRPAATAHGWRTLGHLIGMLLVRGAERGERVAWAMKCRGHAGRFPHPPAAPLARADIGFVAFGIAAIAGLLALELLA